MTGQWTFLIILVPGFICLSVLYSEWRLQVLKERLDEVPVYGEDEV